ncbi:ribonuclease H-like domain-containing protein [Tanacetum coccineum]
MPILHSFEENKLEYEDEYAVEIRLMERCVRVVFFAFSGALRSDYLDISPTCSFQLTFQSRISVTAKLRAWKEAEQKGKVLYVNADTSGSIACNDTQQPSRCEEIRKRCCVVHAQPARQVQADEQPAIMPNRTNNVNTYSSILGKHDKNATVELTASKIKQQLTVVDLKAMTLIDVPTVVACQIIHFPKPSWYQEFAMTDFGALNYFLGISVMRDSSGLFLSQKKYAVEILEKAHMVNCNPSRTPVDAESKLGVDGDPVSDPTLYQSLADSLQYLTFTRPDLSYAVQQLFSSSTTNLVAYSTSDWAGCPTTRRSTSGYYVFLGNNPLSWSSKRQPTLSRSSAEAEYRGVANVVAETCWLRNLLHEMHTPLSSVTLVYCDNVSAIYLSCNPVQHQRTKHIEIDIHFVRDLVAAGQVRVLHVPSRYQFAYIFTKGLPSSLFEEFRFSLSVRCPPAPTAREC